MPEPTKSVDTKLSSEDFVGWIRRALDEFIEGDRNVIDTDTDTIDVWIENFGQYLGEIQREERECPQ